MTRILRLLLIAAVAWPMWQSAAAQEVKPEQTSFPKKLDVQEMKEVALLKEHHNAVPKSSASIKMLKASTKSETNSNSVDVLYGYTGTNRFIPVFGYFHDVENTISQMIYPASILQEAGLFIGDEITKLTFYTDDNGINKGSGHSDKALTDGLIGLCRSRRDRCGTEACLIGKRTPAHSPHDRLPHTDSPGSTKRRIRREGI